MICCLALALAGCGTALRVDGGDGLTRGSPIVITGATTAAGSRAAMEAWIAHNYPGARIDPAASTYLMTSRILYLARLELPGGGSRTLYFDLTSDRDRVRGDLPSLQP